MKITEVKFPEKILKANGFKRISMNKIGNIVLLAGKNGSGKTRILNIIKEYTPNLQKIKRTIEANKQQIESDKQQIELYKQQIIQLEKQIESNRQEVVELEKKIETHLKNIQQAEDVLNSFPTIIIDSNKTNITVVDFVPNKIDLEDWSSIPKKDWMNRANKAKELGISTLQASTLPLIQKVSERWLNTTHPELTYSEKETKEAIDDYERLQSIIKSFLGTKIGWNQDGYSTIFDKPIAQAQLSAGQRVLLQLCVAIFAQGGTFSNHIIFMDEPENHLHPSAVIDLFDIIKEKNPDGQIWIATHSIPLLSHFDATSLWFVEDGTVKHSGKKPEQVLKSLLGDEERIQKLRDFTSLPNELARNRFAFECLLPPKTVETDSKDPQSIQLYDQLKIIWNDKESINLLDFGAGKGRMIANLSDYDNVSSETLNYHAYDSFDSDKEQCLKNISLSYSNENERYHNSIENIRTKLDDNYFDVVVLSNVLHEIAYTNWCETFKEIKKLLKGNGFLLLIEDCRIPTGELPNKNGFIVFSTLHLKTLFNIPSNDAKFIAHDARFDVKDQNGRLMAHLIPSQYLENISINTIKSSLKELKDSSKKEIKRIRYGEVTYSNGLEHSFWVQQLANTILCLEELGE